MNSFPYMPLYWNDMLSDNKVRVMSNEELGAYVRLLAAAWHEDTPGTLPGDEDTLALLACARPARWRRISGRVLACFAWNAQTSRYEQKRMMHEYAALAERNDRRSDAGARAAAARWGKGSQTSGDAGASQSHANPNSDRNASALRTECLSESNSESPSYIEKQRARQPAAGGKSKPESDGDAIPPISPSAPTPPGIRTPSESEILTETQALATSATAGVIPDFAKMVYADWAARGGRDGAGVLVPWPRYVAKRWSREGSDWKAGTHRNQGNNHSPLTPQNHANTNRTYRNSTISERDRDRDRTGLETTAGQALKFL